MFFIAYVLSGFEIIHGQNWRTDNLNKKTLPKSNKTEIKILTNPG